MTFTKVRRNPTGVLLYMAMISVIGTELQAVPVQQNWVRLPAVDTCYLPLTGGIITTAPSLSHCLVFGSTSQRKVASYDETSGFCTLHDQTTIVSTSGDVYVLSPRDCSDVDPTCSSNIHRITTITGNSFDVFCDMDTDNGHWNVIHNRQSSDIDFYRNWNEYKTGFGDLNGNFWLGNDNIHSLVAFSPYKLRIDLEAWDGTVGIAVYSVFQIASEADNYRLLVDGFSGDIRDGMEYVNGSMFSTKDRDNDDNANIDCALYRHGAWWYRACSHSNLNGKYMEDNGDSKQSMCWRFFFVDRSHVPMKKARMVIKRR
ncbi:fibrinogen-like protein A [Mizuhopecten yessoensis]|uniref:fibrinogen-like protein A n=1 Tax=Mizuhopecten yessoensis TaxID=6573 RepID=UPI000B458076|nr:fibrinogen-like protein A [Mizuhopecten yessoensis]